MSAPYRVAFIGAGGIANTHANYYKANERTEMVAASDINAETLAAFCEKHAIPKQYVNNAELLERERPDIVSIATWHGTHSELTIAAAGAGVKAILCEKPMAENLGDAAAMVEACERAGVKLAIHHQTRFSPLYTAARELIAAGAIGQPLVFRWVTGGGLLNNGTHGVDICRYLLGDPEWEWAFGQVERRTNRYERGMLVEDRCAGMVSFAGGARMQFEGDIPEEGKGGPPPHFYGTEGVIRFSGEGGMLAPGRDGWQSIATKPQPTPVEELISWIEGGPGHRNEGRIALQAQLILMAFYESARTRAMVKPPYEKAASPLFEMIADGTLAAPGQEPYDIRSEAALRYALERER